MAEGDREMHRGKPGKVTFWLLLTWFDCSPLVAPAAHDPVPPPPKEKHGGHDEDEKCRNWQADSVA